MIFIWSRHKYTKNLRKHGIDFKKITVLFNDPNTILYDEEGTEKAHAKGYDEDRFILIGYSDIYQNFLIISFTVTINDEIRIISARKARKKDFVCFNITKA